MVTVPETRITSCNSAPVRADRDYVLYWMIAQRRTCWNFALDRAIHWAETLGKPLVLFEPLRIGYRWASVRLHQFIVEGMRDNQQSLTGKPVTYFPYIEPKAGDGAGLLEALAARAAVVVTDDFPAFFLPQMVAAAASRVDVSVEKVDSNGLWPMRASSKVFVRAVDFRRFLAKQDPDVLLAAPLANPLSRRRLKRLDWLGAELLRRWPAATEFLKHPERVARLPIDQRVGPGAQIGGTVAARLALDRFLRRKLTKYVDGRNHPDDDCASTLSPYLHFGHLSAHELAHRLWSQRSEATRATSTASPTRHAETTAIFPDRDQPLGAFLDQVIVWRELGFNCCALDPDYDQFDSLPDWARKTLAKHAQDRRPHVYTRDELAAAATHDPLWNAAQRQLLRDGRLHNYLRMLWGKKVLEWSATPREALDTLVDLNNRYALDGRDPNSYSGIFWIFGRYDRPWGPERPIFGLVRYMSSENTARKLRLKQYLEQFGPNPAET